MTKEQKRHKSSCRRIKNKWSHIKECRMLVEWHYQYTGRDKATVVAREKKRLQRLNREKFLIRKKYERLVAEMIDHYPDACISRHNSRVVERYGFMWCANRR